MCGINNWRSLCILPDTGGRTFARVKHGKIGIRNLLFPAIGGIPRGGRLLGCSRGLRRSGSAFPGRRFALGHFVPRLRLGLVGGRLVSLGWAAPAGLGRILRFIRLLALIRGRSLFRRLALRRPIPGSGKIHHLSSGDGISHTGNRGLLLVSLPGGIPSLNGAGASLSLGVSLPAGADCSAVGDVAALDAPLPRRHPPWLGRADPAPGEQLRQSPPFPA